MSRNPAVIIFDTAGTELSTATDPLRVDPTGTTTQPVSATSLPLPAGAATEATLVTLLTQATGATIQAVLEAIRDTTGIKKITDALPVGSNTIGKVQLRNPGDTLDLGDATNPVRVDPTGTTSQPSVLEDSSGNEVTITEDAGIRRLEILGKVSIVGAVPPPDTNSALIAADTPLTVGNNTITFVIPDGETFHLQTVIAGNEDPTKGSVIEVFFNDGAQHLITRVYTSGQTVELGFPDVIVARDGTSLVGNGVNTIDVRRAKFSGTNIAIDAVVSGYTT